MSTARMYTPLPASGLGQGSIVVTGPDRELMRALSDNEALRDMMRRTPMGVGSPGHGAVALPLAMQKFVRSGLRSVPRVSAKRMRELLANPLVGPFGEPLSAVAVKKHPNGHPAFSGFSLFSQCAANNDHNGTWAGRVNHWNPVCGVAWGSVPGGIGGTNSANATSLATVLALANAHQSSDFEVWAQNGQTGIGSGHRRRFTYHRLASGYGKRSVLLPAVGPDPAMRPTPSSDRNVNTLPRSRRPYPRFHGYRRAAVSHLFYEKADGSIGRGGPPGGTRSTHREVPTKTEKKTKKKLGFALIGAYHKVTEINDLVDALADAIPRNPCGNLPGFRKLLCVVNNWDKIDAQEAAINVLVNEIEDRIVGRAQGKLSDALRRAGGPNATQVNQWVRQLSAYTRGVL